ncbi:outer membrane protein transport protein [Methylobacter sp.]|uniref:OmpP1/FadL family transporter n=1 Tax=Methylobacter sp. TaxID=2051955 RepID=UPI0011F59681|nr:outer membrane protein transport protein [Methylobacter sp.]TAK60578.1 MAG: aromatic hydrocarbon degradation protein [Methylobacter sp.]
MSLFTKNRGRLSSLALTLALLSPVALATNGINLIGFGTESTLMGGADIAVARDTSALNTNPAGLTQIHGQAFDGFASGLRTFDLSHKDSFGNDKHADNKYTFLGGGGYAMSIDSVPCTAGIGLFSQGGAGGVFKNINTAFGNRDDMSSLFAMAKISPGVGCKINDAWSVGASLAITYASVKQKFFPNTSVGAVPFAGYKLDDASALKVGFKLGVQYRVNPSLTLAATYTEKTELPLTDGELDANYSGMGLGVVKYRNASVMGLALPREAALGLAFKPVDAWLLSFKVNWINWADAIKSVTLRATDPENSLAPADYQIVTAGDWKNQWVFASGLAYNWNELTTLYAGYNYGNNPIPAQNSSPLLAGILDHHITLGAARQISRQWRLTGGLEYMLPVKENYTSPLFGNAEVRNEALFLHLMLSRRW